VVCPYLDVVSADLLGGHLFYDDYLLAIVAIPPDVVTFDVGVGVLFTDVTGLTGACVTIVPFVVEGAEGGVVVLHDLEEIDALLDLLELFDGDEAFFNCLDDAVFEYHGVASFSVVRGAVLLRGGGDAVVEGALEAGVFLTTVVP